MKRQKRFLRILLWLSLCLLFVTEAVGTDQNTLNLSLEEKAFIGEADVVQAASLDGAAPLQYTDAKGEVRGISKRVLEKISEMTGLVFEYRLYDTLDQVLNSGADIIFGVPYNYVPTHMPLTVPFLKSETILYLNSSLTPEDLSERSYAAVKGSALPEGVNEKYAIYFDSREESLNAVESGKADYGYGNAYSVAFYTLQNNYRNIVTIPLGKEPREYCMGLIAGDPILLSILNKSILAIDEKQMQTLILEITSQIDRRLTFPIIMDSYGLQIISASLVIIGILLYLFISNLRVKNKFMIQTKKYEILSQISNECLYEYDVKSEALLLSDNCAKLFGSRDRLDRVSLLLNEALARQGFEDGISTIKLPLASDETGVFKMVRSGIHDDQGRLNAIVGKLIDISREAAEKEKLVVKSQIDGLTGLYNATTAKELISDHLENKPRDQAAAFLLMDCDKFKDINDGFGHLYGNRVLEQIGASLRLIFRNTDIIGRVGGDEFCVYMGNIPSTTFIQNKCRQLSRLVSKELDKFPVSLSFGVSLTERDWRYEDLFDAADSALYQAKRYGGGQLVIYKKGET